MALPLRRGVGSLPLRSLAACLRRHVPPAAPPLLETLSPTTAAPIRRRPLDPPCRNFAAPPQVNKKAKEDNDVGPRVNDAIRTPFVRLVTDEGHQIVSRKEALQLAARSDMDLVEVDRKSDPPVCKIMDFHKEKYKKDVKEKERLKTKSAIVLRGGENKEVRFKGKTELKDMMVKADAITRLMERGYRVKCMAMPSGNEGEDLGAPLSRLLELIKDVCIVESGPHLDSKHAYVIVRHVKFATKKGGKKASQAIEDAGKGTRNTVSESPVDSDNKDEPIECGSEAGDRAISAQKGGKDQGSKRELNHSIANPGADREKLHNMNSGGSRASPGQERGETNRYAARRPPIRGNDQGFGQGRYPQDRRRVENEGCHAIHDNQRPLEQKNRSVPRFNQGRLPQDPRNKRRGHLPLTNNQRHPPDGDSGGPTATTKNFGMFSTPKPEPRKENDASASKSANTESPKSYGIFSSKK